MQGLPDSTAQLYFQGCSLDSFFFSDANLSSFLTGKGPFSQTSIFFIPPICLITSSRAFSLLIAILPASLTCHFLYQPFKWTPKSGMYKTPLSLSIIPFVVIQLQDSKLNNHFLSRASGDLSLLSLTFFKIKILCSNSSPFNTTILAATKPNGTYRLVQDFHFLNYAFVPFHPIL